MIRKIDYCEVAAFVDLYRALEIRSGRSIVA